LFPFLANFYLTKSERDLKANCKSVRDLVRALINKRMNSDSAGHNDLLTMMLDDKLFSSDIEIAVDELLTIFFAGS
jgi:cytochrome P450